MASREVFDRSGKREEPADTPKKCNDCQYTETTVNFPGWWDTVHDASNIYNILRVAVMGEAWAKLWNSFTCPPPGEECNVHEACSPKPAYIEGFAVLAKAPDTNMRWRVSMTLGRKIKCVGTGAGKDVPLEPPKEPTKPEDGEAPKK